LADFLKPNCSVLEAPRQEQLAKNGKDQALEYTVQAAGAAFGCGWLVCGLNHEVELEAGKVLLGSASHYVSLERWKVELAAPPNSMH